MVAGRRVRFEVWVHPVSLHGKIRVTIDGYPAQRRTEHGPYVAVRSYLHTGYTEAVVRCAFKGGSVCAYTLVRYFEIEPSPEEDLKYQQLAAELASAGGDPSFDLAWRATAFGDLRHGPALARAMLKSRRVEVRALLLLGLTSLRSMDAVPAMIEMLNAEPGMQDRARRSLKRTWGSKTLEDLLYHHQGDWPALRRKLLAAFKSEERELRRRLVQYRD